MVLGFLVTGVAGGERGRRVREVEARRLSHGTVMRGVVGRGFVREVGPEEKREEEEEEDGWCFGEESVEQAIEAIRAGQCVVVTDDKDRENEGDLIVASEKASPDVVAFMVRYTSGVICNAMLGEDLDRLQLEAMVHDNSDPKKTAFTITCDYKMGNTTGISAQDRSRTLRALANSASRPDDFTRPGHIFPLRYKEGGVLKRAGHTEAAVDLARLAGFHPSGALCEIVNDTDGSMARMPYLVKFAKEHDLVLTSIADLVRYRRKKDNLVRRIRGEHALLPTRWGTFKAYAYESKIDGVEHVALVLGSNMKDKTSKNPFCEDEPVLVRVHSECCTGDVLGSLRCDCGYQLDFALQKIVEEGRGCLLYLRGQEGRGIGIGHKMRAYALQDQGRDTVQANQELGLPVDSREYGIGAQILVDLGISQMRLMTNNPSKYSGLSGYGLRIAERVPVSVTPNPENLAYLRTKKEKMGHWLGEFEGRQTNDSGGPEYTLEE
uniref:GTP cyclohydrolase II domain-containing protein n=1 Tax=Rhodosorus marinus TaxID=101924 RepID=A0A7S0BKV6_9RHOD|mmetsp:Transcript_20967/g.30480  ORF Transcript_20967/g.30480 Transcript_20967/m.30480 type:complete len:493 (+) Transcript_20967:1143-2621(+)|eukprot:CAMPEP_0184754654 /NCGR_PEP_ID=MMETSP0315-20130426/44735_1 /TAXON_ID=101924 /ORGANISM="Rhodosorus marinus, Strain UTEX LB 2760" /LENGTH=492 /DNA_ID=CAMNT_0027234081 /DNA_START=1681 /DNA_END=3159 /DNA_ORIENTATION=-